MNLYYHLVKQTKRVPWILKLHWLIFLSALRLELSQILKMDLFDSLEVLASST